MTHSSYPNLTGSPRGEKEGDTPEVGIQGLVLNRFHLCSFDRWEGA